jgi:pimeloyl-ACP methyl ester carboxylesterase
MTRQTILAVGAAGRFAGLAVTVLSQRDVRVRGFGRNAEQGNNAQRLGATEVVIGDLLNLQSVEAALAGVDAVFYIAPAFLADEAQVGTRFVDAVARSGARRIVFSSVIHPILAQLANHAAKAYRAAFASIDQTEPLTRAKIRQLVIAIGGVKGLGAKVGAMVKLIAERVEEVTLSDCGHFVPEESPDVIVRSVFEDRCSDLRLA